MKEGRKPEHRTFLAAALACQLVEIGVGVKEASTAAAQAVHDLGPEYARVTPGATERRYRKMRDSPDISQTTGAGDALELVHSGALELCSPELRVLGEGGKRVLVLQPHELLASALSRLSEKTKARLALGKSGH